MTQRLVLIGQGLAVASIAASLIGFVQPWAHIDLREPEAIRQVREGTPLGGLLDTFKDKAGRIAVTVKRGAETITGELPGLGDIPKSVSGIQIPRMANQEGSKVAIALLELFTNTRQHIGLKSYAVYLVPGLVVLGGGLLLLGFGRRPLVGWSLAGAAAAVAAIGFWKLLTTNTTALFIAITIGPGLWLSLWAYVGLAASAALTAVAASRAR
jgi:hypothetical protein